MSNPPPSPLTPQQARAFRERVAFAERFFMGDSEVYKALREVCAALDADTDPLRGSGRHGAQHLGGIAV